MRCKDREGNFIGEDDGQDKLLEKLYGSKAGRQLVKVLIRPSVSKVGGWILDRKISTAAIRPFVKANGIVMEDYEKNRFDSYNDFFTRRVRPERRPVDMNPYHLIAPCDSKLTAYQITENAEFTIKNTVYSMESLTRSKKLAGKYRGGYLLLFRLTVDDYHRYCYVDQGKKSSNHIINGVFHTVNPIANDHYPIYKENTRCISFLKSENFGTLMMIEVGALMVGKIVNYHEEKMVERGEEKGRFEFGGSTIILCLKKDRAEIDTDILENSRQGIETKVRYGEKIGRKTE
ncbi:phosphatidylserine decarboxylase [Emergencia sp.]|uniref:phosphatidylserine decarboxylase n=1 Tax=Emergencia sp. TaxID=1926557 RepID=UPI003AF14E14